MFDMTFTPFYPVSWTSGPSFTAMRQHLPALQSLEIIFTPDKWSNDGTAVHCNAWQSWISYGSNAEQLYNDWGFYNTIEFARHPCMKTWIHMVMSFATEHLQGLRKVVLNGIIKTADKKKWEQMLKKDDPSHVRALARVWKDEVLQMPMHELPPRCSCNKNCGSIEYFDYDDVATPVGAVVVEELGASSWW